MGASNLFAFNYSMRMSFRNSVSSSQTCDCVSASVKYIFDVIKQMKIKLTSRVQYGSSLVSSILIIVCGRTKKQMIRINAARVIAFMQYVQVVRNLALIKLYSRAMCSKISFFTAAFSSVRQQAIAVPILSALPNPAFFCFFNFGPKYFAKCLNSTHINCIARKLLGVK